MSSVNDQFLVVENVFDESTLKILYKYCDILSTDSSSHDVWPDQITRNKSLPECYTNPLNGRDKMIVLNYLYNHNRLPCSGKKWIKDADIAIQKIVPGGSIAQHRDHTKFSLTVFLSKSEGGDFIWLDSDGITEHKISPEFNRGIYAFGDDSCFTGAFHEVSTVTGDTNRYTLQLFVFDSDTPYAAEFGKKYDIYNDPSQNNGEGYEEEV